MHVFPCPSSVYLRQDTRIHDEGLGTTLFMDSGHMRGEGDDERSVLSTLTEASPTPAAPRAMAAAVLPSKSADGGESS